MATILIPTPLRKYTDNLSRVNLSGKDVSDVITNLISTYPEVQTYLLDSEGKIRSFVNIFIDSDNIEDLHSDEIVIAEQTVISIVPAIAGGNLNDQKQ